MLEADEANAGEVLHSAKTPRLKPLRKAKCWMNSGLHK